MSCGEAHATPCVEVLGAVVFLIDGEIQEVSKVRDIETHLAECPPCRSEMDHERKMHQMLHEVLTRSCCETAPPEFHQQLAMQLAAMQNQGSEILTEFTMTEISIQIDEFGSIEHREITIETTQEFRFPTED
ncbi:unannotated protein [freshwater metagenome]|uniref:Unannotated protein n=2 Tax=freshwater metagenome TaxID=449393 RepID=A0A6J6ZHJ2_9ZZZZ|nr:hypothetical protein [Actinomycetota bacterium]TRZ87861.1 MAG: hypothetical protein D4R83_01470 [Streptomycetaceae bacterium]MSX61907.1 hypothetical protein [Actinomycetota bacterium]MSZ69278.1 hypothetical protein [Actinomycetota bacterium]MTA67809.1 hypothetical protein [Actinomycetota bacterium]